MHRSTSPRAVGTTHHGSSPQQHDLGEWSVALSVTQRVERRYRTLRIPWGIRLRLRWYARADRRADLPVGVSVASTPVLAELVAEYGEVCERERTRCLLDTDPDNVRLGQIDAELLTLRATLARQSEDVERLAQPPAPSWLARRYPGEENLPDSATRERRAVTHQRSVAAARAVQAEIQRRLDDVLAEQAHLAARVRVRTDLARSHVIRARELTHRKAAVYRRALLRRHPQREELVRSWDTELCDLPSWCASETPLPAPAPSGDPA
ncbi:hypothetical protein SAMN05660642_01764 [Geodermatophilus siccatus]|uniref:Uncharacterized protein n=1 Tax=Geodermatophilus siccatus TaxID=1137991 RepID=A0A1G9R3T7_9ACTN|nr:hypothetical protein SAMN05660642_01764 [Geodermatophilus siccatus]